MKALITTREEYDGHCRDNAILCGTTPKDLPAALAERYPCETTMAVREMAKRGVQANPWHIETWCKTANPPVRQVGGVRLWSAKDIDRCLADLVETNPRSITHVPAYRRLAQLETALADLVRQVDIRCGGHAEGNTDLIAAVEAARKVLEKV